MIYDHLFTLPAQLTPGWCGLGMIAGQAGGASHKLELAALALVGAPACSACAN